GGPPPLAPDGAGPLHWQDGVHGTAPPPRGQAVSEAATQPRDRLDEIEERRQGVQLERRASSAGRAAEVRPPRSPRPGGEPRQSRARGVAGRPTAGTMRSRASRAARATGWRDTTRASAEAPPGRSGRAGRVTGTARSHMSPGTRARAGTGWPV